MSPEEDFGQVPGNKRNLESRCKLCVSPLPTLRRFSVHMKKTARKKNREEMKRTRALRKWVVNSHDGLLEADKRKEKVIKKSEGETTPINAKREEKPQPFLPP